MNPPVKPKPFSALTPGQQQSVIKNMGPRTEVYNYQYVVQGNGVVGMAVPKSAPWMKPRPKGRP